jgi:hypothetical protein
MINENWALFGEIAFLVWILTVTGFILQSFPAAGTFKSKAALYWGTGAVISYGSWVTGMIMA